MLISTRTLRLLCSLGDHAADRLFDLLDANGCDLRDHNLDNPAGLLFGDAPDAFTPWWMVSEAKLGS